MPDPIKQPKTLAETVAKAAAIDAEMDKISGGVDPLGLTVPRAGESQPIDNSADGLEGLPKGDSDDVKASTAESTGSTGSSDAPPEASTAAETQAPAPDPWEDFDEVVYGDSDTNEEFKVRVPKAYSQKVKDGYARRSVMDRNSRYLSQAKAFLEPLVTSGQFAQIQPFLERAAQDSEFAEFLGEAYDRRTTGKTLSFTDAVANASPATQAGVQQALATGTNSEDIEDPYIAQIVRQVEQRVGTMLSPFQQQLQRDQQARAQAESNAQANERLRRDADRNIQNSMNEFAASGTPIDRDQWQRLFKYAQDAGYIGNDYSDQNVKNSVWRAHAAIGSSIPSPAAQALAGQSRTPAAVEEEARAEAARRVAATSNGGGSVAPQTKPTVNESLKKVTTRKKDGSMKKPGEIAGDVIRAMERAGV